jgi:hypothetical protein
MNLRTSAERRCEIDDSNWLDEKDEDLQAFRAYMQDRDDAFQRILKAINAEYDCELRMTCEACPVQVEGTIDGYGLYFRSRWDSWRLAIAGTTDQAIAAGRSTDAIFYHESCAGVFDGSWLEPEQLNVAMRACLTAYRSGAKNGGYIEL